MEKTEEVKNAAETTENDVLTEEIVKTLKCSLCNLDFSYPNVSMTTQDDVKQYKCSRCSIKERQFILIDLPDKGVAKNMIPCSYKDCTERIAQDNVLDHNKECQYRILMCIAPDCQEEVLQKNFASHFKEKHENLYHSEKIVLENIHTDGGICVLENDGKCYVFLYDTDIDTFRMCLCGIQSVDKQFEMVFEAKNNKHSIVTTEHNIVFYNDRVHCYKCLKGDCKLEYHTYCHYGKDMLRDANGKIEKDILERTFGNDVTCIINVVDEKVENDDETNDLLTGKDVVDEVTEDEKPAVPSKTDAIKELLKCPGCEQQLSEPIFQCLQGHAVCKDCKSKTEEAKCSSCEFKIENTRNYIIEEMITDLRLNKQKREDKEITCPMPKCHEMVKLSGISNHYKESHIENFHVNKATLKNVHGYYNVDVLVKNGKTYLLFFDLDDSYFGITVSSLDGEEEFYEVKLLSDDKKLSFIADDQKIIKYNDKDHSLNVPIDPQKQLLAHKQLIILLHAHKCQQREFPTSDGGEVWSCTLPNCRTMKNVLNHLKTCNVVQSCPVTHCSSSRYIIRHWKYCVCLSLPNNQRSANVPHNNQSPNRPTGPIPNPVQQPRPALLVPPSNVLRSIVTNIQGARVLASAEPAAPNVPLSLISDPSYSAETPQEINQTAPAVSAEQSVNNVSGIEAVVNQGLVQHLPRGLLQPGKLTALPVTVTKQWQQHVTADVRNQFVHKVIEAVFPTSHPEALLDKGVYSFLTFARKFESDIYETANSRSEYYHLMAKKLDNLKQELEEKMMIRKEVQLRLQHSSQQHQQQTLPEDTSDNQDTDKTSNDASKGEITENSHHLYTNLNIDWIRRASLVYQINIKETKEDTINKIIKQLFECPICKEYVEPPIHQCVAGHTLCNVCKSKVKICSSCESNIEETRNFILENISDTVEFPCIFEAKGCTFKGGVKRVASHELECPLNSKKACIEATTANAKEAKVNSEDSAANAEEANSNFQEGTDKFQEGTDKFQEGTDKSQEGTDKSEEGTDKCQEGTDKYQNGTDKYQDGTDKSQDGTDTSQEETDKYQDGTDKSQDGTDKSQEGTDKYQDGTDKSQDGTDKSQEGTDKSQEGTDKSQEGTDKSQEGTDNSQEGIDNAQTGTDNSQEGTDKSQKGTDKSQERTDKSQEGTDNSQEAIDKSQEITDNAQAGTDNSLEEIDNSQEATTNSNETASAVI